MLKSERVLFISVALAVSCLLTVLLAGCGGWSNRISTEKPIDMVATGGKYNTITLRNKSDGTIIKTIPNGEPIFSMDFSPDRKFLAVGGTRYLNVWRIADGEKVCECIVPGITNSNVKGVKYSPDGSYIVCYRNQQSPSYKIDVSSATGNITLISMEYLPIGIDVSPTGKYIATVSTSIEHCYTVWNSDGSEYKHVVGDQFNDVKCDIITFSPDEKSVVTGTIDDSCIQFRDMLTGKITKKIVKPLGVPSYICIRFLPDGRSLLVASTQTDALRLFDYQTQTFIRDIGPSITITGINRNSVDLSADGLYVAASYVDGRIDFFDVNSGTLLWTQIEPCTNAVALSF